MNFSQDTDLTTLGWIKPELDATLTHARQALERYAAAPADLQAMRDCAADLHTTHGTLHMVELYGAALVTEEMERVVRGIVDGGIAPREDVYSVLMRGFLQLPDYIERLQSGHKDIPIVLLPLLNDLRAARGEKLLSEAVLFAPNIDADLPTPPQHPLHPAILRTSAASLRNEYQVMLLRWIRDRAASAPLARIAQIFDTLYAGCGSNAARRLWWIAGAVVEGVQSGAIETSVAVKLLFGKLDREIKRLIDDGEAALNATQSKELVKNLLYYLAHEKTDGERAEAVVKFYNLAHLLPTQEELEHAHGSVSGHNRALLDTVAGGIREDLLRVKETLNVYLHSPRRNVADLAMQAETLAGLADTFGMLGMGQPRQLVREQRDAINRIVSGEAEANEGNLLDIAGGLLVIEASLDAHIVRLGARGESVEVASTSDVPRAEVVRLLYVLMQEALVNVTKVKEAIVAFVEAPWGHAHLEPAPGLLAEVAGALDMLGLRDAAKPVNAMAHYIRNELLEQHHVPERRQIDAFADAVASIEYYIEAIREQRGDGERVLEVMRESLAALGYWPEIRSSAEAASAAAEAASAAQTTEAQTPVAVPAAAAPAPDPSPIIDEELRQVFLDEMDEEIANLRKHFPLWRAEPEETDNLKIVRRSFHTLKGSGRLVGALALGDFAWKVENMLNRVLDRSIGASPPLLQVVGDAIDALPNFRNEFSRHERSSFAMEGFATTIDRLCAGDTAPVVVDAFAAADEAEAADTETSVAESARAESEAVVALEETIPAPPVFEVAPLVEPDAIVAIEPLAEEALPGTELSVDEPIAAEPEAAATETPPSAEYASETTPAEFAEPISPAATQEPAVGTMAHDAPAEAAEHAAEPPPTIAPAESQVDHLLLEVLRSEADTHLGVIDAAVERGRWQPLAVREELVRAAHTLNGAFAMVEAPQIAQLLAPLEGWLARSRNSGRALDADGVGVLDRVAGLVRATLAALEHGTTMPDTADVAARIAALRAQVQAGEAIVQAEPEPAAESSVEASPADAATSFHADVEPVVAAFAAGEPGHSGDGTPAVAHEPAEETPVVPADALPELKDTALQDTTLSPDEFETAIAAYEELLAQPPAAPEEPVAPAVVEHSAADIAAGPVAEPEPVPAEQIAAFAAVPPAEVETARPHAPDAAVAATHPVPDIDEDLLDIFVLEAQEILDRSDALVLRLRGTPGDTGLLDALRRDLHTIKGGANMSQLAPIGDLGHAMESLLEGVVEHGRTLDGAMLHAVEQGFDTLHTLVQAAAARQPTTMPAALIARVEALSRSETEADAETAPAETAAPDIAHDPQAAPASFAESAPAAEAFAASPPIVAAAESAALADTPPPQDEPVFSGSEYIRVRAAQLDTMVNGASEVAIYRSRLEQQIASYRTNVVEMEATVSRLREQMRRLELEAEAQMASRFQREGDASTFDPLELDRFSQLQQLSRSLAESMSDLVAIQVGFDQLTRQSESLLMQQSRVSADLQESLMRTRMVPFDSIVPTLRRTLRQTAVALGKEAVLRVDGAQGEMDRTLLERMKAPLEHMLRNALAHGIENVPERLAGGKPVEGNVRIALAREATETVLRISDDGRGLDRDAIRRRAIERGLLAADARIADRELDAFILTSGFSTAESLTQLSGRGVGMDVVANQIKQLGGSLAIESNPGRGAAFTVRLPFTLGVTQAIIVRIGEANYAIPMNAVNGAVHVPRSELDALMAAEELEYTYGGESFPILDLAPLLEETSPAVAGEAHVPLLIVRSGDQHAAVRIDAVHGSREIVVKSVGPQITSVPGILGATIMGDGSVIMILDLAPLLRRVAGLRAQGIAVATPAAVVHAPRRAMIMVVDDSITMRKATTRVLERENMDVVTAKDGIDAIEKLADRIPDLVLLDIEMPRMDGYQFAEHMKGDPRTAQVPIIMITSRTGEKHRQRAQEIGVEGYLGKPYQEIELVRNIRELLDSRDSTKERT